MLVHRTTTLVLPSTFWTKKADHGHGLYKANDHYLITFKYSFSQLLNWRSGCILTLWVVSKCNLDAQQQTMKWHPFIFWSLYCVMHLIVMFVVYFYCCWAPSYHYQWAIVILLFCISTLIILFTILMIVIAKTIHEMVNQVFYLKHFYLIINFQFSPHINRCGGAVVEQMSRDPEVMSSIPQHVTNINIKN